MSIGMVVVLTILVCVVLVAGDFGLYKLGKKSQSQAADTDADTDSEMKSKDDSDGDADVNGEDF